VLFLQQAVTPYKLARLVPGEVEGIGHFFEQSAGRRDAVGGEEIDMLEVRPKAVGRA